MKSSGRFGVAVSHFQKLALYDRHCGLAAKIYHGADPEIVHLADLPDLGFEILVEFHRNGFP
jgi:hypothetical protein